MSKLLTKKELIYIDFTENIAKFFTIELLSVGYNQIQVISTSGNFNNKGREHVVRFEGESAFKEGNKLLYKKFLEKKAEGYEEKEDIGKWHEVFHDKFFGEYITLIQDYKKSKKSKKEYAKKSVYSFNKKESKCDLCKKHIPEKMYGKINDWGRGEGNWDQKSSSAYYKKVWCIECQIEHDIFKKKM